VKVPKSKKREFFSLWRARSFKQLGMRLSLGVVGMKDVRSQKNRRKRRGIGKSHVEKQASNTKKGV